MWKLVRQGGFGLMLVAGSALAVSPADPAKVLRVAFAAADDGFDLVRTANYYSGFMAETIFETLLTYDYLASPSALVPKTVEALPEVTDGGKTYTFHLKKGIYFTDDPAFKGKKRELTAQDYAYTFRRLLDPANRSPPAGFLEGKIVGMNELVADAKKTKRFDYDAPVAGLQTPDRYTLQVRLNAPDYNFSYVVAYGALAASAREVIEAYGAQSGQHPVGTGAYMLDKYVPRSKIFLVANPDYRGSVWNFKPSADPMDQRIVREMTGKKMPQVGRVEVSIIEEEQSRWLAFQDKQIDVDYIPQIAGRMALERDKLKPELAAQNITLQRFIEPAISYTFFNMRDPTVGGYTLDKIALRRAIVMAYNVDDDVSVIRQGQAVRAEMMMPPGIVGFDPAYRSSIRFDPVLANKLLDHYGYKRGADGFRTMPDGKPLVLIISRESAVIYQELAELWKRGLDVVGIHAEQPTSNFADNQKAATECRLMMWGSGWNADFPDGENFLQLLYGPNANQGNHGCYQSAAYDAIYNQATAMPPGPARTALYAQMNRQMEADTAWLLTVQRVRSWVARPWVHGFKKHPMLHAGWEYLDVDVH